MYVHDQSMPLTLAVPDCLLSSVDQAASREVDQAAILVFSARLPLIAGLMAALDVSVQVCCCNEDAAAADAALTDAMQQAATAAPACVMRAFGTSCSKPRLLTPGMGIATRLQRLLHIGLPDITSQQQLSCLPRQLHSLCLLQCSMSAQLLQQLARQCPSLRDVRLAYSMYPSKQHKGPELLDRACAGWTLVPLVDLQFEGRRLPRYQAPRLPRGSICTLCGAALPCMCSESALNTHPALSSHSILPQCGRPVHTALLVALVLTASQ